MHQDDRGSTELESDERDDPEVLRARVRELESRLRDRDRLLELIEGSLDGIWDWEIESGRDYLSPRWKNMLGYEDHELPNTVETWQTLLAPGELERGYAAVQAHFERDEPYELVLRYRRKDGSTAHMLARGVVERREGTPKRMAGTHTDVTPLVEAQRALEARERELSELNAGLEARVAARSAELEAANRDLEAANRDLEAHRSQLATILETIESGVFAFDETGRLASANAAARRLFATAHVDSDPETWPARYGIEDLDPTRVSADTRPPWTLALSGTPVNGRLLRIRGGEGGARIVRADAHPIGGDPRKGAVLVLTDITTLARERAAAREFAYVAAHDLQEPLRKVASYCDLLRASAEDRLTPKEIRHIEFAIDGAERLRALVKELFDFASVGTHNRGKHESCDASRALDDALSMLGSEVESSSSSIERDELPTIAVPHTLAVHAFQNLLSNAIKYRHPERPPHIRIEHDRRGEWDVIGIEDNGIGIAAKHHERIFQIFKRLHARHQYPGTGIGLALCKRVAESCGGSLTVSSTLGKGSRFEFRIPRIADDASSGP